MVNVFSLRRVHLNDQMPDGLGPCGKCPSIERLHYQDPSEIAGPIITVLGRANCDESELCDICTALVAELRKEMFDGNSKNLP